ncbi:MAG: hypothetical protein N3B13_12425, partial [Deltaproteobacteria bacterium]|nr:hypothetical protein [Deltaproteobacteria bacterium]
DKIYETLSNIRFRGRFEIYSREPLIIIDGAHNIDGIKKLIKSIITFNREKRKILIIFSTLSNKDPLEKITLLKDIAHRFIFIENNHPLSLKNEEFIMLARKADLRYSETMNIGTAIEKIFDEYRDYLTVITGSLYTLSEVYNELERLGKNGKR